MFIGYIYKITGACGGVYIGSTVNPKDRSRSHRTKLGEGTNSKLLIKPLIFTIIRQDEYKLVRTMKLVEQYYIEITVNCVNERRAFIGEKQKNEEQKSRGKKYYQLHKEEKREYDKNYRKINQERISIRDKEYKKKYSQSHKEEISKSGKEYREKNKEKIREWHKEFAKIKIECIYCKKIIAKRNMTPHHKTKRCQAIQKSLNLS